MLCYQLLVVSVYLSTDTPKFPRPQIPLVRTIDLGTKSSQGVAANNKKIAVRLNYANMENSDVQTFSLDGTKATSYSPPRSLVDTHSHAISIDPDGMTWLPGAKGDVRLDFPSGSQTNITNRMSTFCTSQYAGRGKRWTLSKTGVLTIVDESGKKLAVARVPKAKIHFIEMFDSASDGSVAASVNYGKGKFGIEIFNSSGKLTNKWAIPEWKERTLDVISYDGKRVMLIRTDGLYGLSKIGKPLWFLPLTTAKEFEKRKKGVMPIVWTSLYATLADGADKIVTADAGNMREIFAAPKHYKVKVYQLPSGG